MEMIREKTLYEQDVQSRSCLRYLLGLFVRWKQHFKYDKAVRIARKNGAKIGDGVIMPLSLARKANANLEIGNHVSIQTDLFSSMRYKCIIGDNVIVGSHVNFVMGSHNIDSPEWEHFRKSSGLVVEDYVWICPNSMILPSCKRIGYGAVIGGGSVVVKDVEPMSVVGGNPAKEIKKRKCVHNNLVVESLLGGDYKIYKHTRKDKM